MVKFGKKVDPDHPDATLLPMFSAGYGQILTAIE